MTTQEKVIKTKLGLLETTEETTGSGILFTPIVGVEEEPFLLNLCLITLPGTIGSLTTNG